MEGGSEEAVQGVAHSLLHSAVCADAFWTSPEERTRMKECFYVDMEMRRLTYQLMDDA